MHEISLLVWFQASADSCFLHYDDLNLIQLYHKIKAYCLNSRFKELHLKDSLIRHDQILSQDHLQMKDSLCFDL